MTREVTPFQALMILEQENRKNKQEPDLDLRRLMLSGVVTTEDQELLNGYIRQLTSRIKDGSPEFSVCVLIDSDFDCAKLFKEKMDELRPGFAFEGAFDEDDYERLEAQVFEAMPTDKVGEVKESIRKMRRISADPIRCHFESDLAHQTLRRNIHKIDRKKLKQVYKETFSGLPWWSRILVPMVIWRKGPHSAAARVSSTAPEYASIMLKLKDEENFPTFGNVDGEEGTRAEAVELMTLLEKTTHSAMAAAYTRADSFFPLDIYNAEGSAFRSEVRGRMNRGGAAKQKNTQAWSRAVGNLAGTSRPLKGHEELMREHKDWMEFMRPVESSDFVVGADVPMRMMKGQIHPFVNSISGTTLTMLKSIARQLERSKFAFKDDPEGLKRFFQLYISNLLYQAGGHSLIEFAMVFKIPAVKEYFKEKLSGFYEIDLESLFIDGNERAFDAALESTGEYCDDMLGMEDLRTELLGKFRASEEDAVLMDKLRSATLPQVSLSIEERVDKACVHLEQWDCSEPSRWDLEQFLENAQFLFSRVEAHARIKHFFPKELQGSGKDWKKMSKSELIESMAFIRAALVDDRVALLEAALSLPQWFKSAALDWVRTLQHEERHRLWVQASEEETLDARMDKAYKMIMSQTKIPQYARIEALEFLAYQLEINILEVADPLQAITEKIEERRKRNGLALEFPLGSALISRGVSEESLSELDPSGFDRTRAYNKTDDPLLKQLLEDKELLDVVSVGRSKDSGSEKTKRKTYFFNATEKDTFGVQVRKGLLVHNAIPVDTVTSQYASHGRRGFAEFVLESNGTLSLFPHFDHDKAGIAHTSVSGKEKGKRTGKGYDKKPPDKSGSRPVICAGEIKVEDGELVAVTDYSGHYRPSLYNISCFLRHLQTKGVDISKTKVYSFKDPNKYIKGIKIKTEKQGRFYSFDAESVVNYTKYATGQILADAKRNLRSMLKQSPLQKFVRLFRNKSQGEIFKNHFIETIALEVDDCIKQLNTNKDVSTEEVLGRVHDIVSKHLNGMANLQNPKKWEPIARKLESFKATIEKQFKQAQAIDVGLDKKLKNVGRERK